MIGKFRSLGLVGPTLFAAAGIAILVWLGTWQMQRKEWKDGLVGAIKERATRDPVPLPGRQHPDQFAEIDDEYRNVVAGGIFDHGKERHLFASDPKHGPGYHVFAPLRVSPNDVVWINRGYVPKRFKSHNRRAAGQLAGTINVVGLVRWPAPRDAFSPDNDVANNTWYWRDLNSMHKSAYDPALVHAYPFFIDAQARPETPGGKGQSQWPKGGITLLKLPNRHLEYALTWYGLAGALLAVYVAFVRSRLRGTARRPG